MGLLDKIGNLLKRGKSYAGPKEKYLDDLAKNEPDNANAHMKLAEVYQKRGEKQKAVSEYLLAADIFTKNQFYARAIAIYKQLSKRDPSLDLVYLKMADIYREKGCLADAFGQYKILAQYYENSGKKEKALNILKIMDDLDPRKNPFLDKGFNPIVPGVNRGKGIFRSEQAAAEGFFDLNAALIAAGPANMQSSKEVPISEKIKGVEDIFKELKEISGPSNADPHFNYNMGVAYRELGFCAEAMEQFEIAVKKRQKPFEALSMLGFCYWEKGLWDDSQQSFGKALGITGTPQEKILNVKYILGLLYQELGRIEEALGLLQEIATVDKEFLNAQDGFVEFIDPSASGKTAKSSNFICASLKKQPDNESNLSGRGTF
jgi:tetratricopeptide (TPR) repeat protein